MKKITVNIGGKPVTMLKVDQHPHTFKDYGTEYTDKAYKSVTDRLNAAYKEAAQDLYAKQQSFLRAHEARVRKYRAQVEAGQITEADYQAWMQGQIFQGEAWAKRREQMAEAMTRVDENAMAMINDGKMEVFGENANYLAYQLEQRAGADLGFGLYDQSTVKRLIRDEPQMLPLPKIDKGRDVAWYNDIISRAVTQGILQGEDLDGIVMRVALDTGEKSLSAMRRNARTAYTGAQNAGRVAGMRDARKLGIQVKKRWMAFLDAHTRDAHAELDGQSVDVDQPFESMLGPIMYPGDPDAAPGNVYNCRCTLVYDYPKFPDAIDRKDDSGEKVGDITYREWQTYKETGIKPEKEAPEPQKEPPQFEIRHADYNPATSVKEAEEYAKQFMGYNGKVSYRGLSVDAANACNQTLSDMRANIPDFKLSGIEPMNMRSNMWKGKTAEAAYRWGGDGKLYINPTYYKNTKPYEDHVAEIDKLMQTVLSSGQELIDSGRVTGTSADYISALLETKRQAVSQSHDFMQGTFVHEMGHALDDKYVRRELRELYPGIDGVRDFLSQSRAAYGGHISGYAIADGNEYIAESFTAWWYGERDKVDPVLGAVFEKVMSG